MRFLEKNYKNIFLIFIYIIVFIIIFPIITLLIDIIFILGNYVGSWIRCLKEGVIC